MGVVMPENIFFNRSELKKCGENVIIGKTVRIRYPELVSISDNVIIDDFTYISTGLEISDHVHIAAGCKIIGGAEAKVSIGSFSTLAPNVVLAAGSDDYRSGIAGPTVPKKYKANVEVGFIKIGRHSIVGANTTIMPNVTLYDGASVGAQSLVKKSLKAWSLNAGIPSRLIGERDASSIEELERMFNESYLT
jgi:acetyltransferase-like isoleucine patch superfamily enzyme